MKRITKIVCVLLAMLMAMSALCACESTEDKYAALAGTWRMVEQDSEEQVMVLLEGIDLYEEEIAVVDKTTLRYAWIYEFDTAGNFRQADDIPATKDCVREFYTGMFQDLYDNRAGLGALYEQDFAAMSQDEFHLFYANLYGFETFDALIDQFVENAYFYDEWTDYRNGTFTFDGDLLDIQDGAKTYTLGYKIEGDTLTISYSDGEEVYTRVK